MATTKTSYSAVSLEEAAPAAAERGFGLDTAPDPDTGAADVCTCAATSRSARSA